jgi:hypothetical protein
MRIEMILTPLALNWEPLLVDFGSVGAAVPPTAGRTSVVETGRTSGEEFSLDDIGGICVIITGGELSLPEASELDGTSAVGRTGSIGSS